MPSLPLAAPTFSAGAPGPSRKISPSNLLEKLIGVDALRDLYARARLRGDVSFFESVLAELEIKVSVRNSDLARIPSSGPVIVCAISREALGGFRRYHAEVVTPWNSRSEVLDPATC